MTSANTRSPAENGGGLAGALVGLGVLTMALFPFLIPGIAIVALFTVPLLVVPIAAALIAVPLLALRSLARLAGRRRRASARPAAAAMSPRVSYRER